MNLLVIVIELTFRILDSLDLFYVLLGLLLGKSKNRNTMSQSVSYSPFKIQSEYLPLRGFGRAWKFIMFLKLVILVLLHKKENQRHSQSITEFHLWGVGNGVGNYLVEGRK